ncbi:condesin subunit E [Salmonella enterica subsp. enterica serovar Madelia]|nr:condesin subunit E [Salmonella enterica subsp. enterica serovar Madelia]
MSLTNIEQVMPVKLAQALANPLFPALDSALRSGRHIGLDELDNHAFLMDFQEYLEEFYARYNVELIRAPEGFLLPASAFYHAYPALGVIRTGYDGR